MKNKIVISALQATYVKHVLGEDQIGWEELSVKLLDALCELMGSDNFVKWRESLNKKSGKGK